MVAALPNAIVDRITEAARDTHNALLREARHLDLHIEKDAIYPRTWVVWAPSIAGYCELATAEACTCQRFQVWGRCPHHALTVESITTMPEGPGAA